MKAMKNLRGLEAVEGLRYGEKNGKISPAKKTSDPRKSRLPEVSYSPHAAAAHLERALQAKRTPKRPAALN